MAKRLAALDENNQLFISSFWNNKVSVGSLSRNEMSLFAAEVDHLDRQLVKGQRSRRK